MISKMPTHDALPIRLGCIAFDDEFTQSMKKVSMPTSPQSLTFADESSQNMEKVRLPTDLQSLTCNLELN